MSKIKISDDKIIETAKKYKTIKEFKKKDYNLYARASKRGLMSKIKKFLKSEREPWTEERINKEAKKYKTRSEFQRNAGSAYFAAKRLGIFDKITSHMMKPRPYNQKWTQETIKKEIKKYQYIGDFIEKSPSAYAALRRLGLNNLTKSLKRKHPKLTKNELKKIALLCSTKKEFREKFPKEFRQAYRGKWYREITSHMKKIKSKWNKKTIMEEGKKYKYASDFKNNSKTAYRKALQLNILEEVTKDMIPKGSRHIRYLYAFEFPNKSVYVGLTYDYRRRYEQHMAKNQDLIALPLKL